MWGGELALSSSHSLLRMEVPELQVQDPDETQQDQEPVGTRFSILVVEPASSVEQQVLGHSSSDWVDTPQPAEQDDGSSAETDIPEQCLPGLQDLQEASESPELAPQEASESPELAPQAASGSPELAPRQRPPSLTIPTTGSSPSYWGQSWASYSGSIPSPLETPSEIRTVSSPAEVTSAPWRSALDPSRPPNVEDIEELICAHIPCVQDVVVLTRDGMDPANPSGGLVCLLTLRTSNDGHSLSSEGAEFAQSHGSTAETVENARKCSRFHYGVLSSFGKCNKAIRLSSKIAGATSSRTTPQLRRYTILESRLSFAAGTLEGGGVPDRKAIGLLYRNLIEDMWLASGQSGSAASTPVTVRFPTPKEQRCAPEVQEEQEPCIHLAALACKIEQTESQHSIVPSGPSIVYSRPESASRSGSNQATEESTELTPHATGFQQGSSQSSGSMEDSWESQNHTEAVIWTQAPFKSEKVWRPEHRPGYFTRIFNRIRTALPCLGSASLILDDDILDPGHSLIKRQAPGLGAKERQLLESSRVDELPKRASLVQELEGSDDHTEFAYNLPYVDVDCGHLDKDLEYSSIRRNNGETPSNYAQPGMMELAPDSFVQTDPAFLAEPGPTPRYTEASRQGSSSSRVPVWTSINTRSHVPLTSIPVANTRSIELMQGRDNYTLKAATGSSEKEVKGSRVTQLSLTPGYNSTESFSTTFSGSSFSHLPLVTSIPQSSIVPRTPARKSAVAY